MTKQKISIAYSPDTDDQFMVLALKEKSISWGNYEFDFVVADIQELNAAAKHEKYDITAISVAAYPTMRDKYMMMRVGGSIGDEFGPAIVVSPDSPIHSTDQLCGKRIAVPGLNTSAYIASQGLIGPYTPVPTYFMDIRNAVLNGEVDAGILIHELQLNPQSQGLRKLGDLGRLWHDRFQLPLPLGANAIRRDLGSKVISELEALYRQSIDFALATKSSSLTKAIGSAIAKADLNFDLGDKYIKMYVNERSLDFQPDTIRAIDQLFILGANQGVFDKINIMEYLVPNQQFAN